MTPIARLSRLSTDKLETLSAKDHELGLREVRDQQQTDHNELGKYVAIAGAPSREDARTPKSEAGPARTVKAIALIALILSLLAIVMPVEQFAVAIPAVILAIATGYCGERIYTAMTAAVTALNLAMLSPHDDLIMAEQPIQIYWTAMVWSAAPIAAMILGYLGRLWRNAAQ
jgi:hypothetical protein